MRNATDLAFRAWLLEERARAEGSFALARKWSAAIPRAVDWVRTMILPPRALSSHYAMAEGSTSLWDPNRTRPPEEAAELDRLNQGVGHRPPAQVPSQPDPERLQATRPADDAGVQQPWELRAAHPFHVLGDRTHRPDPGVRDTPAKGMKHLGTLWTTLNHNLHAWMAGHGADPVGNCNICMEGQPPDSGAIPEFLGHGVYGHAFKVGPELVLKVTSDQSEAALSWKVMQAGLEDSMVIDIRKLRNYSIKRGEVYGILQHLASSDELPPALQKATYLMMAFMRYHEENAQDLPKVWREPGLEDKVRNAYPTFVRQFAPESESAPDDETMEWIKILITIVMKIMNVSGAIWTDVHGRNIMMDKWGKARGIDLGRYVLAEGAQPLTTDGIESV